jgi:hypothetical protein
MPKSKKQQLNDCFRKLQNWGPPPHLDNTFNFTKTNWDAAAFRKASETASPKIKALLNKIDALDRQDMEKHGTLFKHFIFSDIDEGGYGSRIIIAALLSSGYRNMLESMKRVEPSLPSDEPARKTFVFLSTYPVAAKGREHKFDDVVNVYGNADASGNVDFSLPSDVPLKMDSSKQPSLVGDRNYRLSMKKYVTEAFNHKKNSHGQHVRFIVLSKRFKEGLDLYDVKYAHLFESTSPSEEKQAMGRGTRYCGQKNLQFKAGIGWQLHVYKYLLDVPREIAARYGWKSTKFEDVLKSLNEGLGINEYLNNLFVEIAKISSINRALTNEMENQYPALDPN